MTEIGQLVIHFERDMPTRGYPYLGQVCLLGHSGPKKWDMHLTFRSSWSNDRQRDGGEQVSIRAHKPRRGDSSPLSTAGAAHPLSGRESVNGSFTYCPSLKA